MKLFISYSRDDKAWVYELWRALRDRAHHDVWIDQRIVPAQDWWDTILRNIESAECVVYVMTPHSVESIFCQAELLYAVALNKPIVPLMLKPCQLPATLRERRIQYETITDDMSLGDMLFIIERALGEIKETRRDGKFAPPSISPDRPVEPIPAPRQAPQAFEVLLIADEAAQAGNLTLAVKLFQEVVDADPQGRWGRAADKRLDDLQHRLQGEASVPPPPKTVVKTPSIQKRTPLMAGGVIVLALVIVTLVSLFNQGGARSHITTDNMDNLTRTQVMGRGVPFGIAASPINNLLAVATRTGVWIIDRDTPNQPRFLGSHDGWASGVDFNPDGTILASSGRDGKVIFWDVATGNRIGEPLTLTTSWAMNVAFSPDGTGLAAGGCWNLGYWDVTNPENPIQIGEPFSLDGACSFDITWNPAGTLIAYAGAGNTVNIWDVNSDQHYQLGTHSNFIYSFVFSPDGTILASGSYDDTIQLWDIDTQQLIRVIEGNEGTPLSLIFTEDGQQLVSSSEDSNIRVWNVADGSQNGSLLEGHRSSGVYMALSPDGVLSSVASDGTLRFWDINLRRQLGETYPLFNLIARDLVFLPDNRSLFIGNYDQRIRQINLVDGTNRVLQVQPEACECPGLYSLALHPVNPNLLLGGGADDQARLWDLTDDAMPSTFARQYTGITGNVTDVSFRFDGQVFSVAYGGVDDVIRTWSFNGDDALVRRATPEHGDVLSLADSPTGLLAAGYEDGTILLWDGDNNAQEMDGKHSESVRSMLFSLDGQYLISGGDEGSIQIWDVSSGTRITAITELGGPVHSLAFSPDGTILAAGLLIVDQIRLWDVHDIGEPLNPVVYGEFDDIYAVAFSPDGTLLGATGDAGAVSIWRVATS